MFRQRARPVMIYIYSVKHVPSSVIANLQYNNKLPRSVNFVFIPPSNFTLQNGDYFQIDRLTHVEVSCTPKSRPQRSSLLLI